MSYEYDIENMTKVYAAIREAQRLEPMPDDAMNHLGHAASVIRTEIIKTQARTSAAVATQFRFVATLVDESAELDLICDEMLPALSAINDLDALIEAQESELLGLPIAAEDAA